MHENHDDYLGERHGWPQAVLANSDEAHRSADRCGSDSLFAFAYEEDSAVRAAAPAHRQEAGATHAGD